MEVFLMEPNNIQFLQEQLVELKTIIKNNGFTDKWMDKNQASKYIGCCKRTIERAVEQGVLKCSGDNFGKKMFRQTWLDNWLESKRS